MERTLFATEHGLPVPAVTEEQMREVDRIAVEEFKLGILQMMENAGRNLALTAIEMLDDTHTSVLVLAGAGGNGGGGMCAARHLHNHGVEVEVVLDRSPEQLGQAASNQLQILHEAGIRSTSTDRLDDLVQKDTLVIDALIGYSLRGAPRGRVENLIIQCNEHAAKALSLDVPSGMKATNGESPGVIVNADRVLTLALPKTGLVRYEGEIILADIGIPPEVFQRLGVDVEGVFDKGYLIPLVVQRNLDW